MSQSGLALQHIGQFALNAPVMTGSEAAGVAALAGGAQVGATVLPDGCNKVTTVTSGNDSVSLPIAVAGKIVFLTNRGGGNSLQVFGAGIDTINAVATGTGVALTSTKNAVFFCTRSSNAGNAVTAATAGEWFMVLTA
jgi:hypothetical protein